MLDRGGGNSIVENNFKGINTKRYRCFQVMIYPSLCLHYYGGRGWNRKQGLKSENRSSYLENDN